MTSRAAADIKWIVSGECTPSVVALQAVISRRCPVLQYGDVGYLLGL
jgi:hypothetical protein